MHHTAETAIYQYIANTVAEYVLRIELRKERYIVLAHSRDWPKDRLIAHARALGLFDDHPDVGSPAGGSKDTYATAIVDAELPLHHLAQKLNEYGINPLNLPSFASVGKAFKEV